MGAYRLRFTRSTGRLGSASALEEPHGVGSDADKEPGNDRRDHQPQLATLCIPILVTRRTSPRIKIHVRLLSLPHYDKVHNEAVSELSVVLIGVTV